MGRVRDLQRLDASQFQGRSWQVFEVWKGGVGVPPEVLPIIILMVALGWLFLKEGKS